MARPSSSLAPQELAAGHRDEMAAGALDDLQVAHHEPVVEGDRAKGVKTLVFPALVKQLDADFGDFQDRFS